MKKILVLWLIGLSLLYAKDASMDIIKTSKKLPSLAIEDASVNYTKYISKKLYV